MGHPLPLESQIPLSTDCLFKYTVNGKRQLCVVNFGDMPVSPVIKIEGKTGNITMSLGDKSLSFSAGGKNAVVDFEIQTVKVGDETVGVTGEFFELPAGVNYLTVTNSASGDITVTVEFKTRHMYDADYSEIDWGDALA